MKRKLSILFAALFCAAMSFAATETVTINFGSTEGYCNFKSTSVSYTDAANMQWVMAASGTSSFTANAKYSQIGSSSKPASSITMTGTAQSAGTISAISVKMGGFSGTAGTVIIKVNGEQYATGSLNATNDVTISGSESKTIAKDQTIEISVTSISKGVKIYSISYTYEKQETPATGIALDKATLSLDKGATEQLTATLTPADATTEVVWTTDNDAVATVANGLVTAVGVGTANITATVTPAEGTTFTATCAVTVVAAPDAPTFTVTDEVFEGSMNVAIAAAEGMKIYYTTNGDVPTTASTEYTAPFEITATTTVKAIAYDEANTKASVVAEKTYTKAMTCAEANAAADKAVINLNTVTVVYVNEANIYVADATGGTLVYYKGGNYGLKAGQVVKGLKGSMSIYNKLPEIVPSVTLSDLTITEGAVPEPTAITAVPTMANISQYVRINGVTTTAATWSSSDKDAADRTLVAKLGEDDLTLYNTFKIDQVFEARNYNIIGFVTCYNTTVQIAVVSAEPIYTVTATVNDDNMGTVSGAGEYAQGTEVTLKATAETGHKFVNWTDADDNEVSTNAAYTFTVTEDVALIANFKEKAVPTIAELFTYTTDQSWGESTFEGTKFRDVAVHNGVAYALKNNEARIVALDARTGAYIQDLDMTDVSGGAITLSAIQTLADGTLLAINCQSNCATGDVKVYKWADKDATPEVLFAGKLDEALRIDAFYYEGTLENGAIWTSYSGGEKGTTCKAIKIPVVGGVAGTFESYVLNSYALETSSRVISASDSEIAIATKGKMYTWTINADKTTTIKYYTEIGNKRYSNNVKLFEFDGSKYMATVYWGDTNGTMSSPQIIVSTYTALGRWSTTGLTDVFKSPAEGLGTGRNTSFFNGLDVVVGTKGFYVYMTSINGGITACYYGEAETPTPTEIENITPSEVVAPKATKVFRNGQVLILVGDKTYNVMGQVIE